MPPGLVYCHYGNQFFAPLAHVLILVFTRKFENENLLVTFFNKNDQTLSLYLINFFFFLIKSLVFCCEIITPALIIYNTLHMIHPQNNIQSLLTTGCRGRYSIPP